MERRYRLNDTVAKYVNYKLAFEKTKERIKLGPGTLYTILAKFEEEELIEETSVIGRKRNYRITEKGLDVYFEELERLKLCVSDGEREVDENEKNIPDRFK